MPQVIFEPFRIKSVEPIHISSREERKQWIAEAGYNAFRLPSNRVMIDLLTDSGTTAMSQEQWAAMMGADESYAGSSSFYQLEQRAKEVFGKSFIIPVHQGRAAEHLVFGILVSPGDIVPSNGHFDTTAANIMDNGGEPLNLPCKNAEDITAVHPFKGNIDVEKLDNCLTSKGEKVPFVLMTITNNTGGGQPVSLENLELVHQLCLKHKKKLIIDGCRFAENAYFIKLREKNYEDWSPLAIAQTAFQHASIITFSAKKDALVNIGGLVCLDDEELSEQIKNRLILTEGFATYGGLAGRDLAAIAQGLTEVLDENYLRYRLRTIEWMVERLVEHSVPVLRPAGGHALYLDAKAFFRHIPPEHFPGISLVVELYIRGGIRGVELGNVAFGRTNEDGQQVFPPQDLVRLAMPRRVYTEAHATYVVKTITELFEERDQAKGFRFVKEAPVMRHFRSTFAPV